MRNQESYLRGIGAVDKLMKIIRVALEQSRKLLTELTNWGKLTPAPHLAPYLL